MKRITNLIKPSLFFSLIILSGCTPNNTKISDDVNKPSSDNDAIIASNNAVVECKLPGQLRKLGRSMTYFTQERMIKTSQSECKIRGGVYTNDKDLVSVK